MLSTNGVCSSVPFAEDASAIPPVGTDIVLTSTLALALPNASRTLSLKEALVAFQLCTRTEGIIPALEPAHALAYVSKLAPTMSKDQIILMNLCGRGDKDIFAVAEHLGTAL